MSGAVTTTTDARLETAAIEIVGNRATIHIVPWGPSATTRTAWIRTGFGATDVAEVELRPATIAALLVAGTVRRCRVIDTPGWADPGVTAP